MQKNYFEIFCRRVPLRISLACRENTDKTTMEPNGKDREKWETLVFS